MIPRIHIIIVNVNAQIGIVVAQFERRRQGLFTLSA